MRKRILAIFILFPIVANAGTLELDDALRATYKACVGIDEQLNDLKKMAGINTAVTAVGTGLGIGATAVGISKSKQDSVAKDRYIKNIDYTKGKFNVVPTELEMEAFSAEFKKLAEADKEYTDARDKSKKLGNWRTGLMAGSTATNVAGAIIAGKNKVDEDLQTQINNCKASVKDLRNSISQARAEGKDVTEANQIVAACGQYENVDVSKINTRGKGAMVSSIIGTATGVAGTATSAVANSESIRKDEEAKTGKKSEDDWDKEKNINTAANVLAGASTVASGMATIFNATQISAIKKVSDVASKCTEVLK